MLRSVDPYKGTFGRSTFLTEKPRRWFALVHSTAGAIPAPKKLPPLEVLAPESPSHGSEKNGGGSEQNASLGSLRWMAVGWGGMAAVWMVGVIMFFEQQKFWVQ